MATQITPYTGSVPNRAGDTAIAFADNVYDYQVWIDEDFVTDFNAAISSFNTDVTTVNGYVTTTYGYMITTLGYLNDAETAKDLAVTAADYQGTWSAGTYDLGASVSHNGFVWISDIGSNTSEPGVANWTAIRRTISYLTKTANYTAVGGDSIYCDTSGGAFTITLPASPSDNSLVSILDTSGSFGTNALTIARNGETIMGLAEDMVVDMENASIDLIYTGTDWRIK